MKSANRWMAWLAAAGLATGAFAAEITLDQAETAVGNWIARGGAFGQLPAKAAVSGETFEDPDTGAKMHVVRVPGKGFVVTSADDGIEPIILFSDGDGDFVAEEGNPLWDLLRWDLAAREKGMAAMATATRKAAGTTAREKWADLLSPQRRVNGYYGLPKEGIEIRRRPLLKTSWSQEQGAFGVYNMFTPVKTEVTTVQVPAASAAARAPEGWVADVPVTNELGHYPVGCVAVAGGQVMKYWEHPKKATAKKVECQVDGEKQELEFFGCQVLNGTRLDSYKWDYMGVTEPVLEMESEFVSRLLSDIGVTCRGHYRMKGTSMALATLASEMKSTFGYANAVYHTANLSGDGLRQVLIPNIDAGAPVMLGIGHAHAVVADGYGFDRNESTFYVHINLGWGWSTHLWYVPPNIDEYSSIDEIVCNVFPDFKGVILSGRVTGPNGRPVYKMNMLYDGPTHGARETDPEGFYHFLLGSGTYQVCGLARDGTTAIAPQSVTLTSMSRTENGNRVLNFQSSNVKTVVGVAVGTISREGAKGNSTTFSEPFAATLSCATEGAEIRYTLDGSLPGPDSPLYEGPVAISDTVTLRAIAFAEGMECSDMLEKSYTFDDPVSRDDFAAARPISGAAGQSSFTNTGYTKESGEPQHSGDYPGGASAWAVWTAPADGDWTFWLEGTGTNGTSELDTQLAVYTGDTLESLTRIAANDDTPAGGYSSRVSIHARKDTRYMIAMDTYYGAEGAMTLRWDEGYVHWVRLQYGNRFVSRSGGRVEIGVESSMNWWMAECPDWVSPETTGGSNGDVFAFSVPTNGTGGERRGSVVIQAGNSERTVLTVIQHPSLDFATTKKEALARAFRENKRILLVRGRETCGNTRGALFSVLPSAAVRAVVDGGYVIWYSNCDVQTDSWGYASGLGSYTLPLIAILDPQDMSTPVARTTGPQSAAGLLALLEEHADWGGLLAVATETLPAATAGEPYEAALEASGGTPPYAWRLENGYSETAAAGTFAATGTAQGWQGDDACWDLRLPFAFPFFGHSYTNAKVNSNGTISFGSKSFTAYSYNSDTFLGSPVIAVLWDDLTTEGGDIFVETAGDRVKVAWKGAYYGGGAVAFSATLHADGKIVLSYGAGNGNGGTIGVSAGDGSTSLLSAKSDSGSMENADDTVFDLPAALPDGLSLSEAGVLQGTPGKAGTYAFTVVLADAKGLSVTKKLSLVVLKSGAGPATVTTPVAVPHAWLAEHGLGDGTAEGCETAAKATAANGMPVWACYLAGLLPTDATAAFRVKSFSLVDGEPVIGWEPDLDAERAYTVEGKRTMDGTWGKMDANSRFFRVRVQMP